MRSNDERIQIRSQGVKVGQYRGGLQNETGPSRGKLGPLFPRTPSGGNASGMPLMGSQESNGVCSVSDSKPKNSLWFHRTVARRAVKVAADNLKAFGNAVHLYVPRILIRRRNPGCAGLSAIGALKVFNPTFAGHP